MEVSGLGGEDQDWCRGDKGFQLDKGILLGIGPLEGSVLSGEVIQRPGNLSEILNELAIEVDKSQE